MSRKPALFVSALVVAMAAASPALAQPRDDYEFDLKLEEKSDLVVESLLELVANEFKALLVLDPQVANMRMKFANRAKVPLTWRALKEVLKFYEVEILESQSTPGGPWMLQAIHQRSLPNKATPPYRFIDNKDGLPDQEEMVTVVFQMLNGAGSTIFANLRGIMSRDPTRAGNILYVQGPELLIITDTTSKVRYYDRLIQALDVSGPRKQLQIFQINYAPVNELATVVTTLLASLAGSGIGGGGAPAPAPVRGQGGGEQANVIADTRTNQLIVAAFPIDFPLVQRVINALDVKTTAPAGKFHVYQCKDAKAEDLANRINELFTGQAPAQPQGGRPQGAQRPTPVPRPTAGAQPQGTGEIGEVPTRVVADDRTNQLLIQADSQVYQQILAVLDQLDKKRRRVLIEAEVWEITTPTDSLTIGFELAALTNAHQDSTRPAAASNFGLSQVTPKTDANGNITGLGRTPNFGQGVTAVLTRDTFDKLPVIMTAIHNFERANLVTRPFAMTNDNTAATFTISNRQPFLTTTVNNVASQQNVQFVDANSTLTIEPQVNSGKNLNLKLTLEISSFSGSGSANLPPGTNSRRYEGEVTVPNGKYVVFGGLESETDSYVESKVPFLGDIPILGYLFKNWRRSKTKTQVYIFVRPTIFTSEDLGAEARLAGHLRERVHVESERSEWLPPIVPDRFRKGSGYSLQDEAFEVFGTGTANPFRGVSMRPRQAAEEEQPAEEQKKDDEKK
ncbi:MAG: secretin N-terminal domain-containing protein [Planctomycetota bacterium]